MFLNFFRLILDWIFSSLSRWVLTLYTTIYIYLSIYLSVYLSIYLPIHISIYLSIYLSTLKKFCGSEKNIVEASYLQRLMAWTVWLTPTAISLKDIGNKDSIFCNKLFLTDFAVFSTVLRETLYCNITYVLIVKIHYHCLGIVSTLKSILI